MAVLLMLAALMAGPLSVPATATAAPSAVSAAYGIATTPVGHAVGSASDVAFRTSSALATVTIGALAMISLWWYLVVRRRRRRD